MSASTATRIRATEERVAAPVAVATEKEKGVRHFLALGASAGLLGLVLLIAALVVVIPVATHATPYTIVTSSMEPTLPAGTLVVVKPIAADDVRIGDVITYQLKSNQPEVVTHRVIGIQQPATSDDTVRFITKGDANNLADPVVQPRQVRGKVWYSVPLIGWVNNVINGGMRAVAVPLLVTGLFLYAGWMVASFARDQVRKRRRERLEAAERQRAAVL